MTLRSMLAAAGATMLLAAPTASATDDFSGFYHVTPGGIGAGYADYFALFEDGRWEFGDQYVCSVDGAANDETVLHRSGTWSDEGDRIVLTQAVRTVVRGGSCVCDAIACDFQGGVTVEEAVTESFVVDPAAACASDFDPEAMLGVALPCLTIGGVGYFRLGRAEDLLEILGLLE